MTRCSLVAGAVASGEPLTDAEREHLVGCPDCAALVALPSAIARTARGVEPGLGFSSRMQVGARVRITARRRRRVTLSVIGAVAAAVVIFFGVQRIRHVDHASNGNQAAASRFMTPEESARARDFVEQHRFARTMKPAGPWDDIEADYHQHLVDLVHQRHRSSGEKK